MAVADLYPDVSLLGVFTVDSVDFNRLFTTDSIAYRLTGPSIRWKILQFGRVRNNIRVQDARLEQAMIGYEQTLLTAVEEVENVLVAYLEQRERTRLLEQAADAARRAEELQRSLLEGGRTDVQNLLEAQRFRLLVEEQATAARGILAQNLISLYRAMGGGWQYAPFLGMSVELPPSAEPAPAADGEPLPPGARLQRSTVRHAARYAGDGGIVDRRIPGPHELASWVKRSERRCSAPEDPHELARG